MSASVQKSVIKWRRIVKNATHFQTCQQIIFESQRDTKTSNNATMQLQQKNVKSMKISVTIPKHYISTHNACFLELTVTSRCQF